MVRAVMVRLDYALNLFVPMFSIVVGQQSRVCSSLCGKPIAHASTGEHLSGNIVTRVYPVRVFDSLSHATTQETATHRCFKQIDSHILIVSSSRVCMYGHVIEDEARGVQDSANECTSASTAREVMYDFSRNNASAIPFFYA